MRTKLSVNFLNSRADGKDLSASASYLGLWIVFRMNFFFHIALLYRKIKKCQVEAGFQPVSTSIGFQPASMGFIVFYGKRG